MIGWGEASLRSQVSAVGCQVRVFGFGCRYGIKLFPKPITKNNLTNKTTPAYF